MVSLVLFEALLTACKATGVAVCEIKGNWFLLETTWGGQHSSRIMFMSKTNRSAGINREYFEFGREYSLRMFVFFQTNWNMSINTNNFITLDCFKCRNAQSIDINSWTGTVLVYCVAQLMASKW